MNLLRTLFSIALLVCLTKVSSGQSRIFVSGSSGSDSRDGTSWENAKKTIAAGIAAVGSNGTVYVKAGNYNVTSELLLVGGKRLKGGYQIISAGTDTTKRHLPSNNGYWDNEVYCTIIKGAGNHRIASVATGCLLEGCVLNFGYTDSIGGGVLIEGGTVRYCVIKDCDAINDITLAAEGGGAYLRDGSLLSNCVITQCRGDKGAAVAGGDATLINNTITRNWPTHCGTVRDYDGNIYNTVVVGNQCWMRSNLHTTHFNDGTSIAKGITASSTVPCYYVGSVGLSAQYLPLYGFLYNWTAAMHGAPATSANPSGVQGICPDGWHLPSAAEWDELVNFVNSRSPLLCNGDYGNVAKSLCHQQGWTSSTNCDAGSNPATNNATRFGAVPAGLWNGSFVSYAVSASFWTTTESNQEVSVKQFIYFDDGIVSGNYAKTAAMSVRCLKDTGVVPPVVTVLDYTFSSDSANVYCSNTNGGGTVTARGLCWSIIRNPTLSDAHTVEAGGEGNFVTRLHNLTPNIPYHFRAYATNQAGTSYSADFVSVCPASVSDIDGNIYHVIYIDDRCWMQENMRATHLANGTNITSSISYSTVNPLRGCPDVSRLSTYGYLYNYVAATDVCPSGWHLPSTTEWTHLRNDVRYSYDNPCYGTPAKALASQTGWDESTETCSIGNNPSVNNCSGFSAYPAGYIRSSSYLNVGKQAIFWTSTSFPRYSYLVKYYERLLYNSSSLYEDAYEKTDFYSVRCIKNQ